ncbi:MAG: dihydrolipoamide acetyltransferase family protein [bacterium]|nr:dihydrolipoamide acetyltransferase family protein [bacterium]
MAKSIVMPKYGLQQDEGTVVQWFKQVGDRIEKGESLLELETDKALFEYESPEAGFLRQIVVSNGETVPVLSVIAVVTETADEPFEGQGETVAEAVAEEVEAVSEPVQAVALPGGRRIKRSPAARKLAGELGIDLASLQGTGPGGRIVKRDVEAAAAIREQAVPEPAPVRLEGTVPLSRMRQAIGKGMVMSKTTIPHFYVDIEVDMTDAEAWRKQIAEDRGIKLSATDFIMRATAETLMDYPSLNSRLEGSDAMFVYDTVHIGLAVGTEKELLVPVLADVQKKTLQALAKERIGTVEAAQKGRLRGRARATFTISNLGMFGVRSFTAIINPPEAAALAVGGILPQVRPFGDPLTIAVRQVMQLTLSVDHRLADGMLAAQYLRDLKRRLEDVATLEGWL